MSKLHPVLPYLIGKYSGPVPTARAYSAALARDLSRGCAFKASILPRLPLFRVAVDGSPKVVR